MPVTEKREEWKIVVLVNSVERLCIGDSNKAENKIKIKQRTRC